MSVSTVLERIAQIDTLVHSAPAAPTPATPPSSFEATLASAAKAAPTASTSAALAGARYAAEIQAAATRYRVDPALVRAVIEQESGFDRTATSRAGAQGLMQLMPSTARSLGVTDPYDASQSIDGGTRYLRDLLRRFGGDVQLALAGYNAGPNAVARYGGVPPYAETQHYVAAVYARYVQLSRGAS